MSTDGHHGLAGPTASTLIIDLTPTRDQTGPGRLLDTLAGRSAAALTMWLASQPPAFRDQFDVVAMDGFGGYKTAATEVLREAATVMDPFHVVALAGAKLDLTRQRIQQQTCGHCGRSGDPLYGVRRTLRTRLPLLSNRQRTRLEAAPTSWPSSITTPPTDPPKPSMAA
jgi:transposase